MAVQANHHLIEPARHSDEELVDGRDVDAVATPRHTPSPGCLVKDYKPPGVANLSLGIDLRARRAMKRVWSMIMRSWKPSPIGSDSSWQLTLKRSRRPSISMSSTSAVTSMPIGVAAVWLISTLVPTVRWCGAR